MMGKHMIARINCAQLRFIVIYNDSIELLFGGIEKAINRKDGRGDTRRAD